jgi:hypothetical protein
VALSQLSRHARYGPRSGSTGGAALTRFDDYPTNVSSGGIGQFDESRQSRTAIRVAVTLSQQAHSVKLGAEYEDNAYSDMYSASFITHLSSTTYEWYRGFGPSAQVHSRVPTLYAQDAWAVTPRLRVSAGLRWETQYLSGRVGPGHTVGSEYAPRLGVVYQPGQPGSQRLFASAGRFYEQVPASALVLWNSGQIQLTRDFPQNPLIDSTSGVVTERFVYTVPATSGLLGQYYDQIGIGYDRRLGSAVKLGAHATCRVLRWVLEDGDPGDGVYRMGNPGRGPLRAMPRARQRYTALELSLERTTPGPLYLLASYVLCRNVGNYTGLYATDLALAVPNGGPQYDHPDGMRNAYGPLPNDRTHVAKLAASLRLGNGASLGGFLTVESGTPRSEYGSSQYNPFYVAFLRRRGSAGRTPMTWSLDLHADYALPLARGGRIRPRLRLDVFNLGSPRGGVLYDQRHYYDAARTSPNPTYGAVTRYQPPMSGRVGMVVDF